MKKFIKLIYIALIVSEALAALSLLFVWSMRLERHSLFLCIYFCLATAVFIAALILLNFAVDFLCTKARNKKICAVAASLIASQRNYARYVGLLSQALLVDEKIDGKSRLFVKKIKQQTEALSDGLVSAAASIKKLS